MKKWEIKDLENIELVEDTLVCGENEVKLKMSKVALSSTDISYFAGTDSKIKVPGHSAIAYVSEADEESGLKLGSRIVISPFIETEKYGVKEVDVLGVDKDGLLCDFVSVPTQNAYVLPDGIADEEAILAEYIAFGIKIISKMNCEKGDYVVVIGASTLGLIISQLAIYYQLVPILVDLDVDKLKLAQSYGVYYTLNPTHDNVEKRVEEITGGRMSEFAVFAGEGMSANTSLRLLQNGGKAVIGGYTTTEKHSIDAELILRKHITIKGVDNGAGEMPSAINLLANKIIKTDGIINGKADFEDIPKLVDEIVKYPYQYNKILVNLD